VWSFNQWALLFTIKQCTTVNLELLTNILLRLVTQCLYLIACVLQANHFLILSNIGNTCSKLGRLPGSSFMQIRINFAMWLEMPGEMSSRIPSVAIFIPASMGERSGKGISLDDSSHSRTAKLHMSAALVLMVLGDFDRDSGDIHWGW